MAELVSLREYARRRGCAPSAVHKAIQEGRITPINGKIDPVVADIQWAANTRARGDSAAAGSDKPVSQGQGSGSTRKTPQTADAGPDAGPDYGQARARREQAEAERSELELARELEQVIEAKPSASGVFTAFRALRDQLMVQPRKMAPKLASMTDPVEIRVLLEQAQRDVLHQVATKTLPALLAAMGPRSLAGLSMDALQAPMVSTDEADQAGEGAGD
jgi:hypothetical protein